jgi:acyl-CoA thioester hydrolase
MQNTGIGPSLASAQCRFKFPLTYPDTIQVGVRAGDLEEDRFLMYFRIVSLRHSRIAAEGDGLIVAYDYRTYRKAPLPSAVRTQIDQLEGR